MLVLNIGTNGGLFLRDRVIAYPPSPIDTNVRLFVREQVLAYFPSANEFQLILWCDGKHYINTCMNIFILNHIL